MSKTASLGQALEKVAAHYSEKFEEVKKSLETVFSSASATIQDFTRTSTAYVGPQAQRNSQRLLEHRPRSTSKNIQELIERNQKTLEDLSRRKSTGIQIGSQAMAEL